MVSGYPWILNKVFFIPEIKIIARGTVDGIICIGRIE